MGICGNLLLSSFQSMENTKPVAKVKPNKTDEEEESEDSIHLSTEDVSSSHSEYEPNWSESESESSLPPATILPSSQRDKKRKNDHKHTGKPRRSWTNREKEAVWRHLAKHRTLKKVPGKEDCLQCIQAEYALKNRTWKDVKHFVYNTITTEKRKAGSLISNV
ncbi:hypothetical protein AMEX_G2775 [Astyanax mexicanus]|uniref:Uncharacterized protein n=1 Tax=Astyanax mexicanus TaxID=7994 RepID=A0A8T2MR69_ASTMX|nr:hypothetical protein AMEX_G2775 [Astyanax mexicanus]